jgi:hypothetical protein
MLMGDNCMCQQFIVHVSAQIVFCIVYTVQAGKSKYIGTRQQSHRSSHAVPHRIFDDVEEREQGGRKRSLPRETTTS